MIVIVAGEEQSLPFYIKLGDTKRLLRNTPPLLLSNVISVYANVVHGQQMANKSSFHQVHSLDMSSATPTNCNLSFNFIRSFVSMVPNLLELDLRNIVTSDALDSRVLERN